MMNHTQARTNMVDSQIHPSGVVDPAILQAFETVPRELFVPEALQNIAYYDEEVDLGTGRKLLEPMIYSKMIQEIAPKAHEVVLDIGSATGYSSAILSSLVSTVVALEENESFLNHAEKTLASLECCNTVAINAPLQGGYADNAPYDVIIINGAVSEIPYELCKQLSQNGRLICILRKDGESIGRATLVKSIEKEGSAQGLGENTFSAYTLFDANASYLPGFEPRGGFSF